MSDTKHTPGPWQLVSLSDVCQIDQGPYEDPGFVFERPDDYDDSDWSEHVEFLRRCVRAVNAHDDLLATCEFLMARCQDEGLDVLGGAYETGFQHAHQTIANAKANQKPT